MPLHVAIEENHAEVVSLLLDAGADPNAKTENGKDALALIGEAKNTTVARLSKVRVQAKRKSAKHEHLRVWQNECEIDINTDFRHSRMAKETAEKKFTAEQRKTALDIPREKLTAD